MSIRKRLLSAFVTLIFACGITLAAQASAHAAVACPVQYVCLYDPHNYGTPYKRYLALDLVRNKCTNLPSSMNNKTTSYSNNSGYKFVAMDSANCSNLFGLYYLHNSHSSPNVGPEYNDRLTSIQVL